MIKFIFFFGLAAILLIPVLLTISSVFIYGLWRALTYETRFRKFFAKYGNEDIARMVASGKIWTGQTSDQLIDAKGRPDRIERNELDEIWIYERRHMAPIPMRISVGDDRVRTWS